jgi:hypothetical protein
LRAFLSVLLTVVVMLPALAPAANMAVSKSTIRVGETVLVKAKDVSMFDKIDWRFDPGLAKVETDGRSLTLRALQVGEQRVMLLIDGKSEAERVILVTEATATAPGTSQTVARGSGTVGTGSAPAPTSRGSGAQPAQGAIQVSQAGADAPAGDAGTGRLAVVAQAILDCSGCTPGELHKAIKRANPEKPSIVSMRELNKALKDGQMPADIQAKANEISARQKAAQKTVRQQILDSRAKTIRNYLRNNPGRARAMYGYGDIGSWPNASDPDASMDVDYTIFGVDPDVTAEVRDQCGQDLLADLLGNETGLTLQDFDIVVTAEGHERAAGVFETEGGINWAKRNMKRVTLLYPDGKTKTFELGSGDPIREMAYEAHMAKFRDLATKNGDYDALFDARGFLKARAFDYVTNPEVERLWNKYMDYLSEFGVDFYKSRSSTATGGCLDMAKHLEHEVLSRKFEPKAKMKKTLKYVARGDNISRGVPGMADILARDPLLNDPEYRSVVDLARTVAHASDAEVDALVRERFGDSPDAALQELGSKARRAILRMAEVSYQFEMDRIVLEIKDAGARQTALDKLAADMRVIADEGGEHSDLARTALEHIGKMSEANKSGAIDEIRKNYTSLDKIRQADMGLIKQTTEFLRQTELGGKLLDTAGKILEAGKQPIIATPEPKFRSAGAEFVGEVVDMARSRSLKVVEIAGSVAMWAQVIDNVRSAKSDAELAIALGKTLIDNTFFGMVLNSAYAGIVQGDNDALGKAVMYMLVPETALPALVEALGTTAINLGAQSVFESQMEALYKATTWKESGEIEDFAKMGGDGPSKAREFVDAMADGFPDLVAQDMVDKTKASDVGMAANLGKIRAVGKAIKATVQDGNPLIFKEDGPLMGACAAIRKLNADIADLGKALGIKDAVLAQNVNDLPGGLHRSESNAFAKLYGLRDTRRGDARKALAEAIVRTFETRRRAEKSLDGGTAKAEYEALLKIFEELGIVKEGSAALEAEGAPYNLFTSWLASTREKQVAAVKAVQKFKTAFGAIVQLRARAEAAARGVLGETYVAAPRPLTGSLPLTGKPELDGRLAQEYIAAIGSTGARTLKDLELIKKAPLEGEYDEGMLKKLFEVRFKYAYWANMMQAASDAQQLHWAVEIFDKQALYAKHGDAAAKVSALQKEDGALQDEFRKHYDLDGEFSVTLGGPKEIVSGEEAKLACEVRVKRAGKTQAETLPADVLAQYRYAWKSGKAALGEDNNAQRAYKLETVGEHVFGVQVKRPRLKAGQTVYEKVGEAEWKVKVVADTGFTLAIDGATQAKQKTAVPLSAIVKAAKGALPPLKYAWTMNGKSLGDKATASFSAEAPGTYVVTLGVQALSGTTWRGIGEKQHSIVVAADAPGKDGDKKPTGDATSQAEARHQWLKDSLVYLEALKEYDRKTFASFKNGVNSAMVRDFVAQNPPQYDASAKLPEGSRCGQSVGDARNRMNQYGAECSSLLAKGCTVIRTNILTRTINGEEVKVAEPETDCDVACGMAQACGQAFSTYSGRAGYASGVSDHLNQNFIRCLGDAGAANGRNQKELARKIAALPETLPFKRWQEYKAYGDWAGYLAAVDKVKQEFALPDPIPSPPVLPWKYSSPCGAGATVTPPKDEKKGDLNVSLAGPGIGANLKPGDSASLDAKVDNGKAPYRYEWSGASGIGAKGTTKPGWAGDWTVLVKVTDADGKTGEAKTTFSVRPLALKLTGAQGKVFYGRSYRINAEGLEITEPPKPPPGPDPCAGHVRTNNPFDECNTITVDPNKSVSVSGNAVIPTVPIAPAEVSGPVPPVAAKTSAGAGSSKYRYVWQAEPAVEFNAPTTDKPTTLVTYTRMGQVKLWCEAHTFVEGAWHTIGECEQVSVDVVAPAFTFTFTPPDGQGRIGQEVRAVLSTKPEVAAKYLDYRWFDPPSSNRMEYSQNASDIGFKIKDAKPVPLKVLVRVPHYGDTIADLSASYTGVAYDVQIGAPRLNGPQLQMWVCDTQLGRAKDCGMKDIPQGQFVTFQDIYLKAIVTPNPEAPRYRWTVSPSGSCGLPGAGSELHLNCSNTGTYTVNLEVADADGNILGKAESSVSVSVRMEQTKPGKKPDTGADDKVREAMRQVEAGRLDQGIDLVAQAVNLDPKHAEAGSLRGRWQNERQQVTQSLADANRAMEQGDLDKAGTAIANAKRLHPRYQPVLDAEHALEAKRKAKADRDARIAQLAEGARQQMRAGQFEAALATLRDLRALDPGKADALAKELAGAAKQAASAAEQRRDFQQSGKLFEVARQADPNDIEAARGVNNAPVYAKRMQEVRAWQAETRAALDRGDFDTSAKRLFDIRAWEATLPGTLDKVTTELQSRHDRESAAYRKTMDDLRNRAEKAMLGGKCDEARTLVGQVSAKRPGDQERKWVDMMNTELAARARRGECAGAGKTNGGATPGTGTTPATGAPGIGAAGGAIAVGAPVIGGLTGTPANGVNPPVSVSDGANSLAMSAGIVEPGKPFTVRFSASPNISKYSYVPLVPAGTPHGDSKPINQKRLTSQDIMFKGDTLTYTAPTTPGRYELRFIEGGSQKEILSLAFEVRKGAPVAGATQLPPPTWQGPTAPTGGRDFSGGRGYTGADVQGGQPVGIGKPVTGGGTGYVRIEACIDGSDWLRIDNGRLAHEHRAYSQIGTHPGCPASHAVAGGGFLVDGRKVSLTQLPLVVGIANLGRYEVENGRGATRLDGAKGLLLDDDGPGGPGIYIVRLYPGGATSSAAPIGKPQVSFDNGNIGGVENGPRQATTFTLNTARILALIQNYHWNSARGQTPGTIGLSDTQGRRYGPWAATGSPGQGGVPNAYWTARPMVLLPAGTYTVIDSHPASWAHNSQSGYRGFTRVETLAPESGNLGSDGRDYTGVPIHGDPAGAFTPKTPKLLFEIGNVGGVDNNPDKGSKFDLDSAHVVTLVQTYHWNHGRGAPPGTIALRCRDGKTHGPWPATGSPGQGGVANAYWTVRPGVTVAAGTCSVVDSDPTTWAHNSASGSRGFVRVEGYPIGVANPAPVVGQPPAQGGAADTQRKIEDAARALDALKGLFK